LSDLVALGLVASLARPGGNVTGFGVEQGSLTGKILQILQEARAGLSRIALFYTPANPASKAEAEAAAAFAQRLGITLELIAINTSEDFDTAFAAVGRSRPDGMMFHATPVLFGNARRIAAFALDQRIPAISALDGFTREGQLLSYAADQKDMWSGAAGVVDKVLRGASPADVPVELPTKFDLAGNLETGSGFVRHLPLLVAADGVTGGGVAIFLRARRPRLRWRRLPLRRSRLCRSLAISATGRPKSKCRSASHSSMDWRRPASSSARMSRANTASPMDRS